MRITVVCLALASACTVAPEPRWPRPETRPAHNSETLLLAEHNRERLALGVPPLAWDPLLASAAAAYARQLTVVGALHHSSRKNRLGQGENLWMGTRGAFSPVQMVASWASEKRAYRPGLFPAVSSTGNWADVGHYTQMIWPTTTRIGCAIATGARHDFLVCRYAPTGNVSGRQVP